MLRVTSNGKCMYCPGDCCWLQMSLPYRAELSTTKHFVVCLSVTVRQSSATKDLTFQNLINVNGL